MESLQKLISAPNITTVILLGSVLQFLSVLILPIFLLSGYFVNVLRKAALEDSDELPDWMEFGSHLKKGLVVSFGLLPLLIPPMALLIYGCGSLFLTLFTLLSNDGLSNGIQLEDLATVSNPMVLLVTVSMALILLLVVSLFLPALMARFAVTGNVVSLFRFDQAFSDMMKAPGQYFIISSIPSVGGILLSIFSLFTAGLGVVVCVPLTFLLGVLTAQLQGEYYKRYVLKTF